MPARAGGRELGIVCPAQHLDMGQGLGPGGQFRLLGGPFPDADDVTFPVVQTYSDGTEAAWIEPTVEGQGEPQYPAPVLSLSGEGGATDAHGSSHGGSSDTDTDTSEAASSSGDGGGDGLAVTALVLGGLGLLAGVAGLALGLSARRRTVGG